MKHVHYLPGAFEGTKYEALVKVAAERMGLDLSRYAFIEAQITKAEDATFQTQEWAWILYDLMTSASDPNITHFTAEFKLDSNGGVLSRKLEIRED